LGWETEQQEVHAAAGGLWAECSDLHRLADDVLPFYEDFHCHAYVLLMVIGLGNLSPVIIYFPHNAEDA
jgi:hypothetical protein